MNKIQREYAIRRASTILTNKFPVPKCTIVLSTEEVFDRMNMPYFSGHHANYCANYLKDHHEHFEDYRGKLAVYNAELEKIKSARDKLLREATDFIMLGDNTEVLEYLKNME